MKKVNIIAMAIMSMMMVACQKKEEKKVSIPPTPAIMVNVEGKDVFEYIRSLGTTASYQSAMIVPQVSGQIMKINFKQGDNVKAGDILAEIDKRQYEAEVLRAKAELEKCKAQLSIDELNVDRNKELAKKSYVAKQTYDTYLANVEVDKAMIEAAEAGLKMAKLNLEWCDVKSPIDGKVGLYNINVGNIVTANMASSQITSVENLDKLYVDFVLPSQRLYDALEIMKASDGALDIEVSYIEDDFASRTKNAKASIVLNKIRYETGTAIVRGQIDNADKMFWPDQAVKVIVDFNKVSGAMLVPEICVQTGPNGSYVYKATPYKSGVYLLEQVYLSKLGSLYEKDTMRLIESDKIKAGDLVVQEVSQLRLQAGLYAYRVIDQGAIIGEDGKPITTAEGTMAFIQKASGIADELRAEYMKKMQEQAQAATAQAQGGASAEKK